MPVLAGTDLTLAPHMDPQKPAKGTFWGASWEINLIWDPKGGCSKKEKSHGQ